MSSTPKDIPFQQVIEALVDIEKPFSPGLLYRFSDLEKADLTKLAEAWPGIPTWRRKALMEDLEQLGEENTLLSLDAIGRFALKDSDPQVRLPAVHILWEYEDPALVSIYLDLLTKDQNNEVRAAAATGIGHFVYLGEIDELRPSILLKIEERLLAIVNSQDDLLVRRSALESLGFSSREEVPALIEAAFQSGDKEWMVSALLAMGRSCNARWKPSVQAMLDSPYPALRAEAARAAGELEYVDVVPRLVELLDDPDEDTRLASIWSLSQLGGEGVRERLEKIFTDSDNEEERNYIESALDNLTFNEEMDLLPLMNLVDTPNSPDRLDNEFEQYFAEAFAEDFDDEFDSDDDGEEEQEWYDDEDGEYEDEDLGA